MSIEDGSDSERMAKEGLEHETLNESTPLPTEKIDSSAQPESLEKSGIAPDRPILKNAARRAEEMNQGQRLDSTMPQPEYVSEPPGDGKLESQRPLNDVEVQLPQYKISLDEILKYTPEQDKVEVRRTLEEYNKQYIENLSTFDSPTYPGVKFSYSEIAITPDVVERIYGHSGIESARHATEVVSGADSASPSAIKSRLHFLFGGIEPPPKGDAFSMAAMTLDEFIREFPEYWSSVRRGNPPPEIKIYAVGTPTGQGGQVTESWVDELQNNYLDAYSKLFADFINSHIYPNNSSEKDQLITLRGSSRGALVSAATAMRLDASLRDHILVRQDNSAGGHGGDHGLRRIMRSSRVGLGLIGAMVGHTITSSQFRQLGSLTDDFQEDIRNIYEIPEDSEQQEQLKKKAYRIEQLALLRGVTAPKNNDLRTIKVQGWQDPLSQSVMDRIRSLISFGSKSGTLGATMEFDSKITHAKVRGHHFFPPNDHYDSMRKVVSSSKRTMQSLLAMRADSSLDTDH